MASRNFDFLEHTADLVIRVWGQSLAELFCHSAEGLAKALGFSNKDATNQIVEIIEISAPNVEILLVDFLNEILTKTQINRIVYPKIEIIELNDKKIKAKIYGQLIKRLKKDIKAATYHGVKIKKNKKVGYTVDLLFDI